MIKDQEGRTDCKFSGSPEQGGLQGWSGRERSVWGLLPASFLAPLFIPRVEA